jgi:hypothetical protein
LKPKPKLKTATAVTFSSSSSSDDDEADSHRRVPSPLNSFADIDNRLNALQKFLMEAKHLHKE